MPPHDSKKNYISRQAFDYELIAMSFHEGGHAVCALLNFFEITAVSVMTDLDKDGITEFYTYNDKNFKDKKLLRKICLFEIQTMYAGLIAEKIYYKDVYGSSSFPMHLRIGSSSDTLSASKIIRKNNLAAPGKDTHILKKQIQQEVEYILRSHWEAVKIIAHSLYQKKKLSADEIKYLLTRKIENKAFWKERFKDIKIIHDDNNEDLIKTFIVR